MALYDTTAYHVLSTDATPSLPDPTTVSGRTHMLINGTISAATWSSSGPATPFTQYGSNVATVNAPPGTFLLVYSDGAHWMVTQTAASRRVFSGKGVTDASGNFTFTFTPAFATVPVVSQAIETSNTNATEARVTALSASSCTINARQSPGVVILGISVLQVPQPLVGATVHLHAVDAGQV